jgi:hypothetical protein
LASQACHRSRSETAIKSTHHGAASGRKSRRAAPVLGRYLHRALESEEQRLQDGWTYEPPTFFETNSADGPPEAVRVTGIAASTAAEYMPELVCAEE